jgi:hypothetical protein
MRINDKALLKKIGFEPTEPQWDILKEANEKRDITICAGTRFGKSKLCAYIAFKHLLADNQKIWIVSLTYDMSMKIFNYVLEFASAYNKELLRGATTRQPARFHIKEWNSWIECKSADNEQSLMGEELNLAIIDEAARMKPDIWERFLSARLTSRQGKSFIISTPFGQNWFYDRYLRTKEAPDGASFHFTSKDNPYFPAGEWDRQKSILPKDIFDQEYEATFLSDAASVFRNIEECIKTDIYTEPMGGHKYYMGLDLAKFNDFTVITVIDATTHEMVYHDRFTKIPYTLQKERIDQVARKYGSTIIIDALNIGAAIGDELRALGRNVIDFKAVGTVSKDDNLKGSKQQMIEKLSMFLEQRNLYLLPVPELIDELKTYSYHLSPSGNLIYGAPEGYHDDCVSSLGLSIWPLQGQARREITRAAQSIPSSKKRFQYF